MGVNNNILVSQASKIIKAFVPSINQTINNDNGVLVSDYSLDNSRMILKTKKPEIIDVEMVTGSTDEVGSTKVIKARWIRNSSSSIDDPLLIPKRYSSVKGGLTATLSGISAISHIENEGIVTSTYNYTFVEGDEISYLAFEFTPKVIPTNTVDATGNTESTFYTDRVASNKLYYQLSKHAYEFDKVLKSDQTTAGVGEEAHTLIDIKSGVNLDFFSGTAPNRSSEYIEIGTGSNIRWNGIATLTQGFEIWLVLENIAGEDFSVFLYNSGAVQVQGNGSNLRVNAGTIVNFADMMPDNAATSIMRIVVDDLGGGSKVFKNGVASSTNPSSVGTNNISSINVGSNGGGASWRFKGVYFMDSVITDIQADDVLSELQNKFIP